MSDLTPQRSHASTGSPHVLAFYLPQFHQVPENDAWHGPGFTEWTVVARSKPLYPGHRQPELPGELGFYDLQVPETRYRQALLARQHGITGFLYYHYWFGGRRMLGRPFDEVRALGHPDFPFALCWANESWYRRWQSTTDEMLLEQVYSEEDDLEHIRWLIECFRDRRYIRIEGRPLLAVYRAQYLPDAKRTVELWRAECERVGMEPPWLVQFETEEQLSDPALFGFDASVEFVPHRLAATVPSAPLLFGPEKSHTMYDYEVVASAYLNRPPVEWRRYPCVATGWDNTPRRQAGEALILHNSTPDAYGRWLAEAASRQMQSAGSSGIVFVNAWNEWAEGAHLEPDEHWGRAYLEVTRDVLGELFGVPAQIPEQVEVTHPKPIASEDLYHDLYAQFTQLQRTASGLLAYADRRIAELKKHYESKLAWANEKAGAIAEYNEWLFEQLRLQEQRFRELVPTATTPLTEWLPDPSRLYGLPERDEHRQNGRAGLIGSSERPARDQDDPQPSRRTEAGGQEADRSGRGPEVDGEGGDIGPRSDDEDRRDDGYDDLPPTATKTPQWILEGDSSP